MHKQKVSMWEQAGASEKQVGASVSKREVRRQEQREYVMGWAPSLVARCVHGCVQATDLS